MKEHADMKKRKAIITKYFCLLLLVGLIFALISGCGDNDLLDPRNPVTLTLWHPYGQMLRGGIEALIEEFNDTVGADRGIIVQTTYIANASELNSMLLATVNDDPGAPEYPDIAIVYPRIGITLVENDILVDLTTQFSDEELSLYVQSFIEEGRLIDDSLYILPIAKSTEVLYVNVTIFDRFSADTGVTLSQLATFEGIVDAAEKYHIWSDGCNFIHIGELFNMAMTGFMQLGEDFTTDGRLNLSSPVFERVWNAYYTPSVRGGSAIFDGFGNILVASGEAVCVLGTSASISFYPEIITYADNTKEEYELVILPQPIFEGGERVALQRGGGLCVFKTNASREYAAGVFLKWLTDPEQNLRFIAQTGYMPVTEAAYNIFMEHGIELVTDPNVRNMHETIAQMKRDYVFYFPPVFDGFEELTRSFNQAFMRETENSRQEFLNLLESHEPETAYEIVSDGAIERFRSTLR